jgi:hypothetical protein
MAPEKWAVMTTGWTAATMKRTRQPTKKERKTNQKQHGIDKNRETRERRKGKAFPSSPAKPHKAAGRAPLRKRLEKTLGFFRASLSKQEREDHAIIIIFGFDS